jgi:hypothetical protein
MYIKERETFTEEVMREGKKTKGCPGFYKNSEAPFKDKIPGHYKQKVKQRIMWDEFYALGKRSVANKHNTDKVNVSSSNVLI